MCYCDDSSQHDNYEEEFVNVNYESVINKLAAKDGGKIIFKQQFYFIFVVYMTLKYYI